MRVWIVNPFDNLPTDGFRPQRYWLMARAFVRAGHTVTLFTADFSHALKATRRVPEGLTAEGFRLMGVHAPAYATNICLKRVWSHVRFARNWLARARAEAEKPDVLIVSSPPLWLGKAARRFRAETGCKLVLDIQDAWPETFARVLPSIWLKPLENLAGANYRAADAITGVADRYLELAKGYGAHVPMHRTYLGIAP